MSHPSAANRGTTIPLVAACLLATLPLASCAVPGRSPAEERLVLHTVMGSISIALYPHAAQETVTQIKRLVELGVYDSTRFYRIEPGFIAQLANAQDRSNPLTAEQQGAIRRLEGEFSDLQSRRGTVGMARPDDDPDGAETSFFILLGPAPHLDRKYTYFGEVEEGFEVLDALEKLSRNARNEPTDRIGVMAADIVARDKVKLLPAAGTSKASSGGI